MAEPSFQFPDQQSLRRGLTFVFNSNGQGRGRLTSLRREQSAYATSFPCEIIRCQFEDGSKLAVFCKYAAGHDSGSYGQRGGVAYETEVYRRVLQPSQVSAPTFYGSYTDRRTGSVWLVLEYLKRSTAVGKLADLSAMRQAAQWIGRFHAVQEAHVARGSMSFLTAYGEKYYRGWARRASQFAGHWHRRLPWLAPLCERLERAISSLAERPRTIIHGEYYPHNVLYQRGVVRPVDWETAAIGAGEIDLATLTEGWGKVTKRMEEEYQHARWPDGPPAGFQKSLDLARVYVQLRWLGDQPEWTIEKGSGWRFKQVRFLCKRLGLI